MGGKAALGFRPDWIKTVVSMALDSSHPIFFILAGNNDTSKSSEEFKIQCAIRPPTAEFTYHRVNCLIIMKF